MLDDTPTFLRLHEAQAVDALTLLSILGAAFAEYQGKLNPPSGVHHETIDTICQRLEKGRAVIARLGAEAVGCVFYVPESEYVYLGRLSVLPEYRGHGIAGALMDYVERQAAALGTPRVQLGVRLALPRLQDYYTRRGYRVTRYGTHEGYSEPTYVMMEKEI